MIQGHENWEKFQKESFSYFNSSRTILFAFTVSSRLEESDSGIVPSLVPISAMTSLIVRLVFNWIKQLFFIDECNTLCYTLSMRTEINGQWFEWDDAMNARNIESHHISFETAAHVFFDDMRVVYYDALHSGEEDRDIVLGKVMDVLFVVFTERGDSHRIISARLASAKERRIYYGN